jgi:hypothetical protein
MRLRWASVMENPRELPEGPWGEHEVEARGGGLEGGGTRTTGKKVLLLGISPNKSGKDDSVMVGSPHAP